MKIRHPHIIGNKETFIWIIFEWVVGINFQENIWKICCDNNKLFSSYNYQWKFFNKKLRISINMKFVLGPSKILKQFENKVPIFENVNTFRIFDIKIHLLATMNTFDINIGNC